MRNKGWGAARAALYVVPVVGLLVCGCNKHSGTPGGVVGKYVYAETNSTTSNGNAVVALQASGSGALTNPRVYNTGGTGASEPALIPSGVIDTDRNVIVDPSHTLLYAVNQGSDTIAAFRIQSDGSLSAVSGSPFPSGGHAPVSLGLTGSVLTVVNSNLDPARTASLAGSTPNITSFRVNNDGSLTASGSTISLPAGSAPSIALPSPSGTLIFSADFLTDNIRSFQVASNGTLTQAPNSPVSPDAAIFTQPGVKAGAPHHPLGLGVNPTQNLLYVNIPLAGQLAVYSYDSSGTLTFLRSISNPGAAACWVQVTPDGRNLYTSNAGSGDVSWFDLSADPATPRFVRLTPITQTSTMGQLNGNPWQEIVDPSGKFLYVITPRGLGNTPSGMGGEIAVLQIGSDGSLTLQSTYNLAPQLPATGLTQPQGIAAT